MIFFRKRHDGGHDSGVTGYWLIEIKWLFSIVLLKFSSNTRENFHSHAFNALTIWLKGHVVEEKIDLESGDTARKKYVAGDIKYTPRENVHKIHCRDTAWAISFRGPWSEKWIEYNEQSNRIYRLTHGRRVLCVIKGYFS